MTTQTPNYNLVKPSADEFYNVEVQNGNMDTIDTKLKELDTGKADLGTDGKILSSQLPSYVDDVLEGTYISSAVFNNLSGVAYTPETGKIYVDTTTNINYRWSGSVYTEISASLALGETSSTAYRGDRGKAAYDHSQSSNFHIPSGGINGQILKSNGNSGQGVWVDDNYLIKGNDYRPNLLINSNFKNPINQRALSLYGVCYKYSIDRWNLLINGDVTNNGTITVNNGYITIAKTSACPFMYMQQPIEDKDYINLKNKTLTLSVKYRGGGVTLNYRYNSTNSFNQAFPYSANWTTVSYTFAIPDIDITEFRVFVGLFDTNYPSGGNVMSADVEWMKLEVNDHVTPFVPRSYAEERMLCLRYYYRPTYQRNIRASFYTGSYFMFDFLTPVEMRISPSIVGVIDVDYTIIVPAGGASTSGFTFTSAKHGNGITLCATKNSHGMPDACFTVNANFALDAEI